MNFLDCCSLEDESDDLNQKFGNKLPTYVYVILFLQWGLKL
jgi:hypothetical protein